MNATKLILGIVLNLALVFTASAQQGEGNSHDGRDARIHVNKKKVVRYAEKRLAAMCANGYQITFVELYEDNTYKVHFKTNCHQRGELHYSAEWAEFKKLDLVKIVE